MAKREKKPSPRKSSPGSDAWIKDAGVVIEQPIVDTLQVNYMPYAMSVIISRALPEIDGFKPSHRKLLYTMYKMGLLTGARTKSANVVGQTMHLNPHGDAAIYETMVRLTRGNEALLHPYVDSKGNFGKAYSRDMAYAASRYTEVKLEKISAELFRDIDKNTVDMVPNYDNSTLEPTLFPTTFPAVLVNSNVGIAVSMASSICPFNLTEVCETAIALMKDPELASKVIAAVVNAVDVPVTVKFRKGWDEKSVNCVEFAKMAEQSGAAAITLHGRTRSQQYSGTADWDVIREVKQAVCIPVFANGDVAEPEDAVRILAHTGADGVMIGRGSLGDPWLFERANALLETGICPALPPFAERIDTAVRQIELAAEQKGEHIAMLEARRHVNCYLKRESGVKTFKNRICALTKLSDLYEIADELKAFVSAKENI